MCILSGSASGSHCYLSYLPLTLLDRVTTNATLLPDIYGAQGPDLQFPFFSRPRASRISLYPDLAIPPLRLFT